MQNVEFQVTELPDEPRLDKVIPLHVEGVSRSAARKLIEGGSVFLNKKRCKMNAKAVAVGDKIRVMLAALDRKEQEVPFGAENILFEDKDIIVVNKPPFLPTHETRDSSRHHLVLSLKEFLGKRNQVKPATVYLGVHHRLDRDTSGAILFTKRKEANPAVAQAFQAQAVHKTYLAACLGTLTKPLVIKSFLGTSPRNKRIQATVSRNGKYAETEARLLESKSIGGRTVSLVEAKPKTGRTHQIRVHLSENKLPILGDETYGVAFPGVHRVLLHAWQLEILGHCFRAPLPDDFLGFTEPN
jgi:RluA family pseudouridine synthase